MSYNIIPTRLFKSQAKRLIKKSPSLKNELSELSIILSEAPNQGTDLGQNTFQIRLAVKKYGQRQKRGHENYHVHD
jgi:hypothetical protein